VNSRHSISVALYDYQLRDAGTRGLFFLLPHEGLYHLCNRVFRLSAEQFYTINVAGIVFYKLGILLFATRIIL
jgi:hypothetical protein